MSSMHEDSQSTNTTESKDLNESDNPSESQNKNSRSAQQNSLRKQTSTLLLSESVNPATQQLSQDIVTLSLNIDSLETKIPTLRPTSTTAAVPLHDDIPPKLIQTPENTSTNSIQAASLKSTQLHYLEVNDAIATQALENARTATRILEEAKATQIAIDNNLDHTSSQSKESSRYVHAIEQSLERSQKIVRESNFIHNEIKKIHAKTEKQSLDINLETKTKEVTVLIATLHRSREGLDELHEKVAEYHANTDKKMNELHKELAHCAQIRQKIEKKEALLSEDIQQSQNQLNALKDRAIDFLERSEESLSSSKQGQTSFIAVSREIKALQQEFSNQRKRTSNLSADIETATKAIALNKTAVEALTNDVLNIKQQARVSKKPTIVNQASVETKSEVEQLLKDTHSAQKRMSQLLQLNNSVSDRMTKIDKALAEKNDQQDEISLQQVEALNDITQQKDAVKRLIEQANRSHALIVSACKKTALLADQIDTSAAQETEHRNAVLAALKDSRNQKKALKALESKLSETDKRQFIALEELEASRLQLVDSLRSTQEQSRVVDESFQKIGSSLPILEEQRTEVAEMVTSLQLVLHDNNEQNKQLQALQSSIQVAFGQHKAEQETLQCEIIAQLQKHASACKEIETQQNRLEILETDFSAHIANIEGLSQSIQTRMQTLCTQHESSESLSKELDYSKTELRYLKEQCDQLLKECIEQSNKAKKQETSSLKSIQKLEKMEIALSKAIESQKQQEQGLDQLNTLVNNALNDLNVKINQFQSIEKKAKAQQSTTQELLTTIKKGQTAQDKTAKNISVALKKMENHLKSATDKEEKIASLESTINEQTQQQSESILKQKMQIEEQTAIIESQLKLFEQVQGTYDDTQKSLETIDTIRKKAQQSFAHLGAQKTKFEQAFEASAKQMQDQDIRQERQDEMLTETQNLLENLSISTEKTEAFSKWQDEVTHSINEKLQRIDEYQSRAFQAQKATIAREQQLEERYSVIQEHIDHFQQLMEKLDSTRIEEAQFRDELRSLAHHHERQQKNVEHKLSESQEQHDALSRSLEDAHLMFRENKLATKETQMANRETKLILQEIRREITQLQKNGIETSQVRQQWAAEERIEALTAQLEHDEELDPESNTHPKPETGKKSPPYTPASFML